MPIRFPFLAYLRSTIYIVFYVLCLRQVVLFFKIIPAEYHIWFWLSCLLFLLLSFYLNILILYGIFISVPIFSGLQVLKVIQTPFPLYSLLFSAYFLFWLPSSYLRKKGGAVSTTEISNLTDLLAGMVVVSLLVLLGPFFPDMLTYHLWIPYPADWDHFNNYLFSLNYGFILLQGYFLFRVLENEFQRRKDPAPLFRIIAVQAVLVLVFFIIQLLFDDPPKYSGLAAFSPFYDIHSFGSYAAVIFFICLSVYLGNRGITALVIGLAFLTLSFFSYSRTTWGALIVSALIFGYFSFPQARKIKTGLIVFFLFLLASTILLAFNYQSAYLSRLQHLLTFKDLDVRMVLWKRAIDIILDFPITGSGIGTFYRYSVLYQDWETSIFRDIQDNAHNYFLQFASDLGLPALIILLSIFFYSFKIGWVKINQASIYSPLIRGIFFGLIAYLLNCITGYPLFLDNHIFFFWFLLAALTASGRLPSAEVVFQNAYYKSKVWKIGLTVLLIVGYTPWIWGMNQRRPLAEIGFHAWECAAPKCLHWTARKTVTNTLRRGSILEYTLVYDPQFVKQRPQRFQVTINGEPFDQRNFFYRGSQPCSYYLPPMEEQLLQIRTEVDQTVNYNRIGLNTDTRDRGVLLSEFKFSDTLPLAGIGFYDYERWNGAAMPSGWPTGKPLRVRWTALRASIPKPAPTTEEVVFWVYAGNPDISQKPLHLKIYGEKNLLHEVTFRTPDWQRIAIPADRLKDTEVFTFQTDRVWNPKAAGLSEDVRDLGVAIATP